MAMQHTTPHPGRSWSTDQLLRLEYEWRRLQRSFAYHPSVRVIPLHGDPPDEYQFELRVRTLAVSDEGELQYLTGCSVHVSLPDAFPYEPPLLRPLQAVFHPNVTMDAMLILPPWDPKNTLVDLVGQVGALLAYQTYDPWDVWNPAALDWLNANMNYLPTDPNLDLRPEAGGEPLMRIARQAAASIQQSGNQLREFTQSLSQPNGPSQGDLHRFVQQMRLGMSLFTDEDIPASARAAAAEVDDWAAQLPQTWNLWAELRRRSASIFAADAAA